MAAEIVVAEGDVARPERRNVHFAVGPNFSIDVAFAAFASFRPPLPRIIKLP